MTIKTNLDDRKELAKHLIQQGKTLAQAAYDARLAATQT